MKFRLKNQLTPPHSKGVLHSSVLSCFYRIAQLECVMYFASIPGTLVPSFCQISQESN